MTTPTRQIPTSTPYAWPHDSSLHPSTTALLILDMQRDFVSETGYLSTTNPSLPARYQTIVPRLVSLLSTFRRAGYSIFHTRTGHASSLATLSSREHHRNGVNGIAVGSVGPYGKFMVRGQRGYDTISELCPLPNEPVIDKAGRGAFAGTELEMALRSWGVRNLVICGITVEGAVNSTVREASERGFDCLVVEDGVEGTSEELKWWGLEAIKVEGGLYGVTGSCYEVINAVESWSNIC